MASIVKLENGTYRATVYIGRDDKGKNVRQQITLPSLREAKAAAAEIEQDLRDGKITSMRNTVLSVYCDKWFDLNKEELAPTTRKAYKMYIEKHIKPTPIGKKRMGVITETDVLQWIADNTKNAACTKRKHFFLLQSILRSALKGRSPCIDVSAPAGKGYEPIVPTRNEFSIIREAVRGTFDEIPVMLIGKCGIRPGEMFALQWNDFDFEALTLRIDKAMSIDEEGGQYVMKEPKSNRGKRTIAVSKDIMDLIQRYKAGLKTVPMRVLDMRPDSFGKRFAGIIDELVKTKHIRKIRFYDLRHYHATEMYRLKIPDQYAAKRLGHDVAVLKGIYQHLHLDDEISMDNRVRAAMDEDAPKRKKRTSKAK